MKRSEKMLANSNAPGRSAETLPQRFEDLPNVGRATADDLRLLGLQQTRDLLGRDPLRMYRELEQLTGSRQDPCVLDVFIALTRLAAGDPPHPWWHYTAERKARYGDARDASPRQRRKR